MLPKSRGSRLERYLIQPRAKEPATLMNVLVSIFSLEGGYAKSTWDESRGSARRSPWLSNHRVTSTLIGASAEPSTGFNDGTGGRMDSESEAVIHSNLISPDTFTEVPSRG